MGRQTVVIWINIAQSSLGSLPASQCCNRQAPQLSPPSRNLWYARKFPIIYTTKEMERVGLKKKGKTTKTSAACNNPNKMRTKTQDERINEIKV